MLLLKISLKSLSKNPVTSSWGRISISGLTVARPIRFLRSIPQSIMAAPIATGAGSAFRLKRLAVTKNALSRSLCSVSVLATRISISCSKLLCARIWKLGIIASSRRILRTSPVNWISMSRLTPTPNGIILLALCSSVDSIPKT